jgi:SAM-dependent methyltransferase
MTRDYDGLADIYDLWSDADPSATPSATFYVERMLRERGHRVELGVGTGRIAIPVLRRGGALTGVDSSPAMLDACRRKAVRAGVSGALELIRQDVRDLDLPAPAELIIFPFRSLGHLLEQADKAACFRSVYANLVPGGRFIFDHYVWNEDWARAHDGVMRPMVDQQHGQHRLIIQDEYHYRYDEQRMDCAVHIQLVDGPSSEVVVDRVETFEFSWFDVDDARAWATSAGFDVEALHGGFESAEPFGPDATDQVWTLRKPVKAWV